MVPAFGTGAVASGQVCSFEVVATITGPECSPGTFATFHAWGMDEQANVAGSVSCLAVPRAALWTLGDSTALALFGPPSTGESIAFDILDPDHIVGVATPSGQNFDVAAYWQVGSGSLLGALPDHYTSKAQGINVDLQIVGESSNPSIGGKASFLWQNGVMQMLQLPMGPDAAARDINCVGQVVGWMGVSASNGHAFIWQDGVVVDLGTIPGGVSGDGWAVNSIGHVAGRGIIDVPGIGLTSHACLWDGSTIVDLGILPQREASRARDLNDIDQIVGDSTTTGLSSLAFLWQDGTMFRLNDLVLNLGALNLGTAAAINNEGWIIAENGVSGFLLRPVASPPGDIDNNCTVNVADLLMLLKEWGNPNSFADTNGDGNVNVTDLLQILADWG